MKTEAERKQYQVQSAMRRANQRRAFLSAFKSVMGCADCGTSEGVLQFDHRDPATKRFTLNLAGTRSWESIAVEIAKCDVRCASCHTTRHHRDDPEKAQRAVRATHKARRVSDNCLVCGGVYYARGLCQKHYRQKHWTEHGR